MTSKLLEPPEADMCVFLLGEVEEEESRKEVGCQYESPEDERRREVGCQSETAERRDAAVQVDLLSQQLCLRQTDSPAVLLQCISVRPDGPDGGALLQHCTSPNKHSAVKHQPAAVLTSPPAAKHLQPRSGRGQRKRTLLETKARQAVHSDDPLTLSLRRRSIPRVPLCRIAPHAHSLRCCSPPSAEEDEEPQQEEDSREGEVVEDVGDPTWTPPRPDSVPEGPQARLGRPVLPEARQKASALQELKLELENTMCDVCGKVMKCKSSLARHSFIHTGKKPYGCHLCHMRFNRRDNLQHHLSRLHPNGVVKLERRRTNVQTWLCEVCGKTFNCRSRLKTHEAIHSGVKPFHCDLCPKAYMRNNDLEHHKKVVHVDGADQLPKPSSLLCDFCGKEFKCKSQLAIHFQTHTGERPHLCDVCGRKFGRLYQLKRHRILVHLNRANADEGPERDLPYVCTVCGKRLKSEALLIAHSQIHTSDKPHRCGICLRSFLRATCLKQHHLRVHLKMKLGDGSHGVGRKRSSAAAAKVFPCPICSKVFRFRSLLASHSVVHTEVKPHSCEFCNRCFRRLSHLKRHREVVHANGARLPQSYVCQVCGIDKKCKSQLARHVIIHTGERPYACDLCPARFNRSGNLQQHKRRMHSLGGPLGEEATPTLIDENGDSFDSVLAPALSYKQEETVVTLHPADEGFDPGVTCDIVS